MKSILNWTGSGASQTASIPTLGDFMQLPEMRWFANFGLSLAATECAMPTEQESVSVCPLKRLIRALPRS